MRTFKISIKTYFGIGRKRSYALYQDICDTIWDLFFSDRFGQMIYDWESGKKLYIGNYEIDQRSIRRLKGNTEKSFDFTEMELMHKYDHLLINSSKDQTKYMKINYLDEWNWPLIYEILNSAVKPEKTT